MESASYDYYKEEYQYDSNNNLTQLTNSRNEKYVYTYYSDSLLPESEKYYVSNVLKRKTDYTYNSFGQCTETVTYTKFSGENAASNAEKIISKQTYKDSGAFVGALLTEEDSLGRTVRYFYDSVDGKLLATVNEDSGDGTAYVYDSIDRLIAVRPAAYIASSNSYSTVTGAEEVEYTYDAKNMLSKITTESTEYLFYYDKYGNTADVVAGDKLLASYTYNDFNGKLAKIEYGNGLKEEYVYNELDMLSEIWYNKSGERTKAYSYSYTSKGSIYRFDNHITGQSTIYDYDSTGRLESVTEYSTTEMTSELVEKYSYHDDGRLHFLYDKYTYDYNGTPYEKTVTKSYTYYSDGKIKELNNNATDHVVITSYGYDAFNRLTGKETSHKVTGDSSKTFNSSVDYTYTESGNNLSTQIETYTSTFGNNGSVTYTYTYDANGNITKISYSTGEEICYRYDDLGQLIREDNSTVGFTYVYIYDNAGNITEAKRYLLTDENEEVSPSDYIYSETYVYSNSAWGDRLTSYNGHTITYDGIGNPLSYYNGTSYSFTWTGRQLTGASLYDNTISFTYNDEGIRTSKTVNGVKTTYYLSGTTIVAEETNGNVTIYLYDESGAPIGFQYRKSTYSVGVWDTYWYEKNLHGDIVAIYSDEGVKLVTYTYDAWGNTTIGYHNNALTTTVVNNPFTYRGYYYDSDLGLYYLNSRYYDSSVGRFINADGYVATGTGLVGYNMYSYCNNNPIMYVDQTGEFPWILVAIIAAVVVTTIVNNVHSEQNEKQIEKELGDYEVPNGNDKAALENYLQTILDPYSKEGYEVKVTVYNEHIHIENSYLVDNSYDRQKICTIISESGYSERSANNLSAEWFGHNFFNEVLGVSLESTDSVDLEKKKDPRLPVYLGAKALEIYGIR